MSYQDRSPHNFPLKPATPNNDTPTDAALEDKEPAK